MRGVTNTERWFQGWACCSDGSDCVSSWSLDQVCGMNVEEFGATHRRSSSWVCHFRGQSDMRVSKTRIQREMGTVNAGIRKFQKGTGLLDQSHYYAVFAENLVVFWHIIKEKLEWVWVSRTRSQLFDRDETAQHLRLVVLTALSEICSENSQQKGVQACGLTEDCDSSWLPRRDGQGAWGQRRYNCCD